MPLAGSKILVFDETRTEAFLCIFKNLGFVPVEAEDASSAADLLQQNDLGGVVVNLDSDHGRFFVEEFLKGLRFPVLFTGGKKSLKDFVSRSFAGPADFLVLPCRDFEFKVAAKRFAHLVALFKEKRFLEERVEKSELSVATERFLAVRQIVDKLSSFVAQVAADVEGGVRYFNEMPYFVSIHDRNGKVIAANSNYRHFFGNRIGKNSWDIYVGRRATFKDCPVGETLRSRQVKKTSAFVRYLSGARIPVMVHTAPVYDNEGEVVLVLEIFTGTKELKDLSEEVRVTQQRYRQLFDSVPSRIAVIDRLFTVAAANHRLKEEFGDIVGRRFFDVMRPAAFPAFRDPVSRSFKDGLPHKGEMVLTDPSGIQHHFMVWTSPIKTSSGKLIQVIAIMADMAGLRRLEDNLSSIGLMMSSISHDLKGCLTGLDAGLYMIEKGFYRDLGGRIEEGLDVAKLMAERIRKMVNDILFSAKERELEIETIDAVRFAGEVAASVAGKIKGGNIDFFFNVSKDLKEFEGDSRLLRSALVNILENAVDACIEDPSPKKSKIEFSATKHKDTIRFVIKDNAGGMDTDQKEKIFDLFYSSKGIKGTGIGLFVTRKIIKKHGGRILVESDPSKGSCFTAELPVRPEGLLRRLQ